MKKIFLILISLLATANLLAQVTFESSYTFSGTITDIGEGEYKYFVMDVPLKQCRIYNEDHSIYKTINLTVPSNYYLYDIKYVSRHTFNNDDLIELLYIYSKEEIVNSDKVYRYGMKIVNESGTELMSLTDGGFAEIKEGSEGKKLLAYQYIWNESYYLVYTNIYAIGGSTKSADNISLSALNLYPNPTDEQLTIESTVVSEADIIVHDIYGRKVLQETMIPGNGKYTLQTGNLAAGTYILRIVSDRKVLETGKFEKLK